MTDPHADAGNTDYTTGAPPNDTVGMTQGVNVPSADPHPWLLRPYAAGPLGPQPMPEGPGQNITDPPTIDNPMRYIDTDDPTTIAHFQSVNAACKMVYDVILQDCPRSAERTLAIRKLQEARMWANAAIAFDGKTYQM